ncbi:MAG TPA: ABC transporter ATP-binding protein [Anaerolineae bacterium]|nr:ABC transporter ATP-binding protein [Anaerolineae bacterium]HQI86107.1 ABC transporter ATP-binding protein [Anaerolineae bacterium]
MMEQRQPSLGNGRGGAGAPGNLGGGPPQGGPQLPGPGGRRFGTPIEKARDMRGTVRRLLGYLRPHRLVLVVATVLVVASTLLDLVGPYLNGVAIDRFITRRDVAGLGRLALLMLGVYLVVWVMRVALARLMVNMVQKVMRTMRAQLFGHLQTLSLSFFDQHPHGDLMSRLTNDLDALGRLLAQNVTDLISGLLSLVGIVVMMFSINFWLSLGSMFVFPLMLWFTGYVGKRTRQGFREFQRRIGQLNGELEEIFSGQRVILAFGQEGSTLAKFDRVNEETRDVGIRAQTYANLIPPLMGIFSNANIAILAGLGGWMVIRGWATVGTILTFYNYSRRFANPLRQLGDLYNQIQSALAGAERVFELLDQQPEILEAPNAIVLDKVQGDVIFDHVTFSYVPDVPVIKDMSFHAEPGKTMALVGPTGAGKTTMINLLSRFYDIQGGSIRIDGVDLRDYNKASLRRKLGVVLQDTFLFSESVMENIRYGRLDATDEEVIAAATLANADQFIRRLPQGYQTELSERGSNLSQGQRQLLAIARAILADPGILILDEATSSVDTRTEQHIQEALLRLMEGRTSFVIAHRLSTIREADTILVINDGEIIERGSHQELLAQQGFYHHLYVSQFRGQVEAQS